MPKMGDDSLLDGVESFKVAGAGNFTFSGTRPDRLTAVEYTLATIIVDTTGSVQSFEHALLNSVKTAVDACRKSPRAENLLIRVVEFNSRIGVQEVHGFLALNQIKTDDYKPFRPYGSTNLRDAVYSGVQSMNQYADMLVKQDFSVNGAMYIVTDGDDNASHIGISQVKDAIKQAVSGEKMESLHAVLIAINAADPHMLARLQEFQTGLGLNQFVDAGDATPGKLAKLAQFVSKSISSQSQSLGTGGVSKNLTF